MISMQWLVLGLFLWARATRADYECLCCYQVESRVYDQPSPSSNVIGYMYEFDCKQIVTAGVPMGQEWVSIATEHMLGFVLLKGQFSVQTCDGNPPETDVLTTPHPTTSLATSTVGQTNTTPLPSKTTSQGMASSALSSNSQLKTSPLTRSTTMSKTSTGPTSSATGKPTINPIDITTKSISAASSVTTKGPINIETRSTVKSTMGAASTSPSTPTTSKTSTGPSSSAKGKPTINPIDITTPTASAASAVTTKGPINIETRSTATSTMGAASTSPRTLTTPAITNNPGKRSTTSGQPTAASSVRPVPWIGVPGSVPGNVSLCPTSMISDAKKFGGVVTQYGNSCYELVPAKYHWSHAESYCKATGGHLFHVSSAAEETFILDFLLLNNFNHAVWMGLNDLYNEEIFEWTSGAAVSYTNWTPNRKSNFFHNKYEDCVVLVPYLNNGKWDDIPCGHTVHHKHAPDTDTEPHAFICQTDTTSQHTLSSISPFLLTSSKSLSTLSETTSSHSSQAPGQPVRISTPTSESTSQSSSSLPTNSSTTLSSSGIRSSTPSAAVGSMTTLSPLATKVTTTGTKVDITSRTTTSLPLTTSGDVNLCPPSMRADANSVGGLITQYGNSCYEFVPTKYHWWHAESYCNQEGGHLFHLANVDEEIFLLAFLVRNGFNQSVWMGFNDVQTEERFEWTSGASVTYTNWTPDRKSNKFSNDYEDCVVFVPTLNNGEWDDIPCGYTLSPDTDTEAHAFICQTDVADNQSSWKPLIGR